MRQSFITALALLFFAALVGCAKKQYSYFEGTISHGPSPFSEKIKQNIGASVGARPDEGDRGLWAFQVGDVGWIVFVYDKPRVVRDHYLLSDASLKSVWTGTDPTTADWKSVPFQSLLKASATQPSPLDTAYQMDGQVHIERWDGNTNFRIQLHIHSADSRATNFDGVLTTCDQWELF